MDLFLGDGPGHLFLEHLLAPDSALGLTFYPSCWAELSYGALVGLPRPGRILDAASGALLLDLGDGLRLHRPRDPMRSVPIRHATRIWPLEPDAWVGYLPNRGLFLERAGVPLETWWKPSSDLDTIEVGPSPGGRGWSDGLYVAPDGRWAIADGTSLHLGRDRAHARSLSWTGHRPSLRAIAVESGWVVAVHTDTDDELLRLDDAGTITHRRPLPEGARLPVPLPAAAHGELYALVVERGPLSWVHTFDVATLADRGAHPRFPRRIGARSVKLVSAHGDLAWLGQHGGRPRLWIDPREPGRWRGAPDEWIWHTGLDAPSDSAPSDAEDEGTWLRVVTSDGVHEARIDPARWGAILASAGCLTVIEPRPRVELTGRRVREVLSIERAHQTLDELLALVESETAERWFELRASRSS